MERKLIIYADGAARGNPGPAAIGVVIADEHGRVLREISCAIGRATNNQAEYRAVIAGLEEVVGLGATHVELRADSELVVKQLNGRYRVKHPGLLPLLLGTQPLRGDSRHLVSQQRRRHFFGRQR